MIKRFVILFLFISTYAYAQEGTWARYNWIKPQSLKSDTTATVSKCIQVDPTDVNKFEFLNCATIADNGDLEMGAFSIDGDEITGLYFDPDNDGADEITFNIDGTITIGAITITATDGSDGQVLTTDGAGNVAFETVSGGGGGGGCFELDGNSDLMPVSGTCTDTLWEEDGNGDLQPQA